MDAPSEQQRELSKSVKISTPQDKRWVKATPLFILRNLLMDMHWKENC
jgi:hypothetical protein